MACNAAGLDVSGANNPNWKGGLIDKVCAQCGKAYRVKRPQAASRFCSLQCVGIAQRGKAGPRNSIRKNCSVCDASFVLPKSHAHRSECCSRVCAGKLRAEKQSGEGNPNWAGGVSRLPYPYNFRDISRDVIARDGGKCRNPSCAGTDPRMTTHHIDYDKQNCVPTNLIALCSACNSKANFGRAKWQAFYTGLIKIAAGQYPFRFLAVTVQSVRNGGGWSVEPFD